MHLEETGHLNVIAFDKTGTLTKGYPEVVDFIPNEGVEKEQLLQKIAAVESLSQHPLAKAIVNYAREKGLEVIRSC